MEGKFQMFINRGRLKGEMFNKNVKTKDLAEALNITRQQMTNKLNGKSRFLEEEIKYLRDIFGNEIFF